MRVAFEHNTDPRLVGVQPKQGQVWHNTGDNTIWCWSNGRGWERVTSVFELRGLKELIGVYGSDEVARMAILMDSIMTSDPEGLIGKKWAELHMVLKLSGVSV